MKHYAAVVSSNDKYSSACSCGWSSDNTEDAVQARYWAECHLDEVGWPETNEEQK